MRRPERELSAGLAGVHDSTLESADRGRNFSTGARSLVDEPPVAHRGGGNVGTILGPAQGTPDA